VLSAAVRAGVPLVVKFRTQANQEQVSLLLTTAVPLRSITFSPCDPASCIMLRQPVRMPETGYTACASFAAHTCILVWSPQLCYRACLMYLRERNI